MKKSSVFSIMLPALMVALLFVSCENEPVIPLEPTTTKVGENAVKKGVVTVTDRNPSTFGNSLINAVKSAGWNGTVKLESGNYFSDRIIILPSIKTNIIGAGKTATYLKLTKNPGPTSGFLILGASGTTVKNITVDAQHKMQYGACAINTNGFKDVYMNQVGFSNSSIGTGTPDNGGGQTIAGLSVIGGSFYNCDHGINFNRKFNNHALTWVKKVTIKGCWFGGKQSAGISIDCGNDGADGPERVKYLPKAVEAQNTVTNMDGMEISGCTFKPAKKYNIAVAKAWNIKILNNTLEGNTGELVYGECINLEHEAHHVVVEGNKIRNESAGVLNKDFSYISILTFRDYSNPPLLENGCRNITIRNNTFRGGCKFGISGEYAQRITINNNDFVNSKPTVRAINFYTKSKDIWHWSNTGAGTAQVNP